MEAFHATVACLFGLVVGSFLNVVIWRLPRGENLSRPRSACPGCGKLIVWYDNIPVLSWILLGARCRGCKSPIRWRYPAVEALTGALFLLAWQSHGADVATAVIVSLFLAALVAISFIDLDHRIIPDAISKPGMLIFLALAPFNGLHEGAEWINGGKPALNALINAGAGIAVGMGTILLIRAVGSWLLKKEAMGLGDVKLLGLIGAVVGPLPCLYALALACLGGALIGGVMFVIGRRRPMPCGVDVAGTGEHRDLHATFVRMRVGETGLELRAAPPAEVKTPVRVALVLPATRILEDDDAHLALEGHIAAVEGDGDERMWILEITKHTDEDADRVGLFSMSYKYIPFGPFLAFGGALCAVYGREVHWLLSEGYPSLFHR
jgi:leader peptidase (prepilin peptidase)/N-methyltransferase